MELEKKESVTPPSDYPEIISFLILCLFPCYFFIVGFFASPPDEIIEGIITILRGTRFSYHRLYPAWRHRRRIYQRQSAHLNKHRHSLLFKNRTHRRLQ